MSNMPNCRDAYPSRKKLKIWEKFTKEKKVEEKKTKRSKFEDNIKNKYYPENEDKPEIETTPK